MKMWAGRFRQPLDPQFEQWQRSFPFDQRLLLYELAASRAHAQALGAAGVLSAFGIAAGTLVHIAALALGLAALLTAVPLAYDAVRIAGAIYVSCAGRGGPHFGGPSAEMQIVRHALGDVPLVGFFAAGEVARHHLYGYTGVLTVFR